MLKENVKELTKKILCLLKEEQKIPIPILVDSGRILNGKVALITGGSSGIGFAIAEQFLKSGCKVIIAGTNEEKLLKAKESLISNLQRDSCGIEEVKELCGGDLGEIGLRLVGGGG